MIEDLVAPIWKQHLHTVSSRASNRRWSLKQSKEEKAYFNAKYRCTNPSCHAFKDYGGRGIEFRFTSFKQFFTELGLRPNGMSLERINNNGHYEPGNVKWGTHSEQMKNRRKWKQINKRKRGPRGKYNV